jgi:hypothetical protein
MTGQIDLRLKQLSYSSLLTLHNCPRKFQLYKLQAERADSDTDGSGNVTFAYGHVVGEGIQDALQGKSEDTILWNMFLGWHADLFDDIPRQNKNFYKAVMAVQKFLSLQANGYLSDWELYYHDDKPAVELSFIIHFPNGFVYRGYVDAVLVHKTTREVMVLECKTTSATNLNAAQYKNSAQGIGYSIVLDVLFPDLSSYEVLYLVYKTKEMAYEQLPFTKSYLQRALWIRELLLDIDTIVMYEESSIYPMHGESCYEYFRECEYLQSCTMSTSYLTTAITATDIDRIGAENSKYQIQLTLNDLIEAQLRKE